MTSLPIGTHERVPDRKVRELKQALEEHNAEVAFKDEGYKVWWHWLVAAFAWTMFWFHRIFTDSDKTFQDFITTMSTFWFNPFNDKTYIYFPAKDDFSFHNFWDWCTCWHELRHVIDDKNHPIWYKVSYVLFPFPVFVTMRSFWEYRGYASGLAAVVELVKKPNDRLIDSVAQAYARHFYTGNYAYMDTDPEDVSKNFEVIKKAVLDGKVTKTDVSGVDWNELVFSV